MEFTDNRLTLAILYELVRQEVEHRGIEVTPEMLQQAEAQAKVEFAPEGPAADAVWAELPVVVPATRPSRTPPTCWRCGSPRGGLASTTPSSRPSSTRTPSASGTCAPATSSSPPRRRPTRSRPSSTPASRLRRRWPRASGTDGSAPSGGLLYTEGEPCPSASGFVSDVRRRGGRRCRPARSPDPVQTDFGWHIILVDEFEEVPFAEAKEAVRAYATQDARDGAAGVRHRGGQGRHHRRPQVRLLGRRAPPACGRRASRPRAARPRPLRAEVAAVGRVTVVGLGPAGPELVTAGTLAAIERIPGPLPAHPSPPGGVAARRAPLASTTSTTTPSTFDDVYRAHRRRCSWPRPRRHGEVLYAVPGSPLVAERTVTLLRARAAAGDVEVVVSPRSATSTWPGRPWASTPSRPASGSSTGTASRWRPPASGARCSSPSATSRRVLSDIKLAFDVEPGAGPVVTVLQRLGSARRRRCARWRGPTSTGTSSPTT